MGSINNVRFCGKQVSYSFLNAIRPDYQTKECPDGYFRCNDQTDLDNTLCATSKDECPILHLEILPISNKSSEKIKTWEINYGKQNVIVDEVKLGSEQVQFVQQKGGNFRPLSSF